MKQIIQHLDSGDTEIIETPAPSLKAGHLLIEARKSLISPGTERMLVDFGHASYLEKAKQQPEKVRMVLEKVKNDGLLSSLESVQSKLSQPIPLGYSHVGVVKEVGDGVTGFKVGDRVVSNGPHAEMVRIPVNLCAKIPDEVEDDSAAFTIMSAIALQGVRLAQPTIGETFAVIGAGLIGLLTVQLLQNSGCKVLAVDYDTDRLDMAATMGASTCDLFIGESPVQHALSISEGKGIDGVLITASTNSDKPISQSAQMCRKRGRIILVGVAGLKLNRADFYEKELTFQVSCSYGPGRYDPNYEEKGQDYPQAFVRWTEQRNFQAVLDLMARQDLIVHPMITHRFEFTRSIAAYQKLSKDKSALGILLEYNSPGANVKGSDNSVLLAHSTQRTPQYNKQINKMGDRNNQSLYETLTHPRVSCIGAGNYASRTLIPCFKKAGAELHTLVTTGSINAVVHGRKSGFQRASSDTQEVLSSRKNNTIVIATQHNTHAELTRMGLLAGKHLYVEKPLALNKNEFNQVVLAYKEAKGLYPSTPILMIGFNRRFSPFVKKMKQLLSSLNQPMNIIITINAGHIPKDHWVQNPNIGGGRIIGEACHFIDLARHLAGNPIKEINASFLGKHPSIETVEDKACIMLIFEDGSIANIHYLANGASSFPKERIEIFCNGKILQLNNFKQLKGFGWSNFKRMSSWKQDKGQYHAVLAFLSSIEHEMEPPIPIEEIFEVSDATIKVAEQAENRKITNND